MSKAAKQLQRLAPDAVPFAVLDVSERQWVAVRHLCASSPTELVTLSVNSSSDPIRVAFSDVVAASVAMNIRESVAGHRISISTERAGTLVFGGLSRT